MAGIDLGAPAEPRTSPRSVGVEHSVLGECVWEDGGSVEAVLGLVVAHRHAWVGVAQLELDVAQRQLPVGDWWARLTAEDRAQARALFQSMGSDAGFVNDLRQGRSSGAEWRLDALSKIRCPTLVTGSRHDRGVRFAYAQDLANVIPGAVLMELDSPSHIFWIGPGRAHLTSIVQSFID